MRWSVRRDWGVSIAVSATALHTVDIGSIPILSIPNAGVAQWLVRGVANVDTGFRLPPPAPIFLPRV